MKAKPLPTKEELDKLYSYDPETGVLIGKRYNKVVGYRTGKGYYLMVNIRRKNYQIHRIIWMIMTGEDPGELVIDHINGDKTDNRWENLRAIPTGDNRFNHKQVCIFRTPTGKFWARVTFRKELKLSKHYGTEAEAKEAVRIIRAECKALI